MPAHGSDLTPRSEGEQRDYCRSGLDAAARAERAAGTRQHDLALAGSVIRLVFAGAALELKLLPALSHLVIEPAAEPDVVWHIWDTASTDVGMAPPPFAKTCFTHRGDIWSFLSRRVRSAYHFSDNSLSMLDLDRREGFFWIQSSLNLPYWTIASPLRTLLHWWMEERGGQLLHAAAVGTEAGAVLITGKGGVGKSTTALSCLAAGMGYVGDDYVVVTLAPEPAVHSLYCTAKVNVDAMPRFARFQPRLLGSPAWIEEKAVMFLHDDAALVRRMPLRAVMTPVFGEVAETRFRVIPPEPLRNAAAFTTLCQLPHSGSGTIAFIDRMLAALRPGLELRLGSDIAAVPGAIVRFLAGAAEIEPADPPSAPLPAISVVIPSYNGARFLAGCVGSIVEQDYPGIELIIVDDGSSDDIAAEAAALPMPARLIRQENAGPAAARNLGIRHASAEFVAFLDVDDLWPADKLRTSMAAFSRDPALAIVTGHAQLLSAGGDHVDSADSGFPNYIGAAVIRRSALETVGSFDERLRFAEDTDWFERARENRLALLRLDQITLLVRRHDANMTRGRHSGEMTPVRLLKNALERKRLRRATVAPVDAVARS